MTTENREPNAQKTCASRRLFTVPQWVAQHNWPPVGGLRHLIFHANSNGFEKVIRRVGRTVLIDEAAFFEWVDERKA